MRHLLAGKAKFVIMNAISVSKLLFFYKLSYCNYYGFWTGILLLWVIQNTKKTVYKVQEFPLISWRGNLVETHSFRRILGCSPNSTKTVRNLGKISVFYLLKLTLFCCLEKPYKKSGERKSCHCVKCCNFT